MKDDAKVIHRLASKMSWFISTGLSRDSNGYFIILSVKPGFGEQALKLLKANHLELKFVKVEEIAPPALQVS